MDTHDYPRTSVLEWDENDVHAWFSKLGYPQYEHQIKDHRIRGDVLCLMDPEYLKEVGISTIGQRLSILKSVYLLKLAQNIPIGPDHYIPPSEADNRPAVSMEAITHLLRQQDDRLRFLEDENRRLSNSLHSCVDDISSIRSSVSLRSEPQPESPVQRQPSFKWASFVKPSRSPTKPIPEVSESPQPSPQRAEHDPTPSSSRAPATSSSSSSKHPSSSQQQQPPLSATSFSTNVTATTSTSTPPRPSRQESSDNLKSFKVSLDDPAWKVLPAALKKYKINNDDWQNYAMFICYGSPGNRIERCLSYDEKPLLLFQKLKDAKKNPVFMLKHIKDIRSPIAVAQQKQAARKASSETSSARSPPLSSAAANNQTHAQSSSQGSSQDSHRTRPPKLQVNSHLAAVAPGMMTGTTVGQSGWPEIMSPAVDSKGSSSEEMSGTTGEGSKGQNSAPLASSSVQQQESEGSGTAVVREIPPSTGVSYAVAIYPYMAEQEDEFDVVVGDTFIILSRARGWWVVQRDPAGSGVVEPDTSKQGWVPAGCLLETNVPVATAIAEATATRGLNGESSPPTSPPGKTPILPLSILSTSFPGIALMDYKKKGEEELDLAKDDSLRVFKRYNHWSYAVKEDSGDRGWVPSWFIGKVPAASGVPATPSTSGNPNNFGPTSIPLEGGENGRFANDAVGQSQQAQVSPMSSAFPPMQTRTTAVI